MALGIVLFPFALFLLLCILLYIPPVQNFVKDKVVSYASEATGLDISVRRVSLSFPVDLVINDAVALDTVPGDTLFSLEKLKVDVRLMPLLRSQVEIDGISIDNVTVDTKDMIEGIGVKGRVGGLSLVSHGVDLSKETVIIDELKLHNSNVFLSLSDTTASDTTSSEVKWKVHLRKMDVEDVGFTLDMPLDTMNMSAYIGNAKLEDARADLFEMAYSAARFSLGGSRFAMNSGTLPPAATFDPSHIAADNISLAADSLLYHGRKLNLVLRDFTVNERSGLKLVKAGGRVMSDSTYIILSKLGLETPNSSVTVDGKAGWTLLDSVPYGGMALDMRANIGMADVACFAGDSLVKQLPEYSLLAEVKAGGELDNLEVKKLEVSWGDVMNLTANAVVKNVLDSVRRSASAGIELVTGNLDFVKKMAGIDNDSIALPRNMVLDIDAGYEDGRVKVGGFFTEGTGRVDLKAAYGLNDERYSMDFTIDSIDLKSFLPKDSISALSAGIVLRGKGLDPCSISTTMNLKAYVDHLFYSGYDCAGLTLTGRYRQCSGWLGLDIANSLAYLSARLNVGVSRSVSTAGLKLNIYELMLDRIVEMDNPLTLAANAELDLRSDLKNMIDLKGRVGDFVLKTPKSEVKPKDIRFDAYTDKDTTALHVSAGDLELSADGDDGVMRIADMASKFGELLALQLKEHRLDYSELRRFLPDVYLQLYAYGDNPLSNYMKMSGLKYDKLAVQFDANRDRGIAGRIVVDKFVSDSIKLDTIKLTFLQDSANIRYRLNVLNSGLASEFVSNALVRGQIDNAGGSVSMHLTNNKGESGLLLGCRADFLEDGLKFSFFPEQPVFFFRPFFLNKDNELTLRKDSTIFANIDFIDPEGMNFLVHSYVNERGRSTLTASLDGLHLEDIKTLVPMLPDISGKLSAEAEYTPLRKTFSLSGKVNLTDFVYEKKPVMDIGAEVGYLPLADNKQLMRAKLLVDGKEAVTAGGRFQPGADEEVSYKVNVKNFPLGLVNPFVPDGFIEFTGGINGEMTMKGSMMKPDFNGQLSFDSTYVMVTQYGAKFRFEDKPLVVSSSRLKFDRFSLFTSSDNPFVIDGNVDFSDLGKMTADIRLGARNYELLNAKRTKKSIAYGKAFIDANVNIKGPVDALSMNGYLKLLGQTNLGYVLKDSPLTVQNRLGELVTFVNLNDTTSGKAAEIQPVNVGGMDVLLNVSIDPAVRVTAHLSEYGNDKVELEGGGDLSLKYSSFGDLFLSGRYTLSGGKLYYSLPIVSSMDFNVTSGSFVEWSGNAMNPRMNITAVKKVRADVTDEGSETPRKVDFNVSININNTLENLGLAFDLAAPDDMTVQNELSALGAEERSKQAITMLVTNRYGSIGKAGGLSMGSAINSLLQTEISNITRNIKAVDISVGMESRDGTDDLSNMDYSFRLAKRFWNDRLNVIIGGKISGDDEDDGSSNNQNFIDNVSVEYRLDSSGTRYVKAFHTQDNESILEGEVMETGLGVVLRKKMIRMAELFKFGSSKKKGRNAATEEDR